MSSKNQRKLYAERLRQLQRLGYSAYEGELINTQPPEAAIEQCAPPGECRVRDLMDQGTLYMVWLSVAAERDGVCLHDFRFVPPWPDQGFQTLRNKDDCPRNAYILPNGWSFPLEDILNERFGATGWRLPLTPIEGWLCGHSLTPIPPEFKYGELIEVGIEFFGKSGRQLAQIESTLWVDRSIEFTRNAQLASERAKAESGGQPAQSFEDYLRSLPEAERLRKNTLFERWESNEQYLSSLSAENDRTGAPNTPPKDVSVAKRKRGDQ